MGGRPSGGKGARQIGRISVLLSLNRLTTRHKLDSKLGDATGGEERNANDFLHLVASLKIRRNKDNMRLAGILFHFWLTFLDWIRPLFSPDFYEALAAAREKNYWSRCCHDRWEWDSLWELLDRESVITGGEKNFTRAVFITILILRILLSIC